MQIIGQNTIAGGGYGGDHKTPLPTLKFREKPPTPPSPTRLRNPSNIPANMVRYAKPSRGTPRDDDWVNPLATPSAKVAKMIEMYESGMSVNNIGKALQVSHTTVLRHLRNNDIPIRGTTRVVDVEEIRKRFNDGESLRKLGRAYGASASTVARWLDGS